MLHTIMLASMAMHFFIHAARNVGKAPFQEWTNMPKLALT